MYAWMSAASFLGMIGLGSLMLRNWFYGSRTSVLYRLAYTLCAVTFAALTFAAPCLVAVEGDATRRLYLVPQETVPFVRELEEAKAMGSERPPCQPGDINYYWSFDASKVSSRSGGYVYLPCRIPDPEGRRFDERMERVKRGCEDICVVEGKPLQQVHWAEDRLHWPSNPERHHEVSDTHVRCVCEGP